MTDQPHQIVLGIPDECLPLVGSGLSETIILVTEDDVRLILDPHALISQFLDPHPYIVNVKVQKRA